MEKNGATPVFVHETGRLQPFTANLSRAVAAQQWRGENHSKFVAKQNKQWLMLFSIVMECGVRAITCEDWVSRCHAIGAITPLEGEM